MYSHATYTKLMAHTPLFILHQYPYALMVYYHTAATPKQQPSNYLSTGVFFEYIIIF